MLTIRPPKRLLGLSSLLIAGLMLAACGGGNVGVSPAGDASPASPAAPAAPTPPVAKPVALTGTPASSVTAGQNYLFQPTVSQGGGTVTFQIQGKPSWAAFDVDTGVLTGKPAAANEGTTGSITITGSNGSTSASIGPFAIDVKAPATAPPPATGSATLSWTPPTENDDGTPITGLAGYHIYYGTNANALTTTVTLSSATDTSYVVSGLASGTYYFAVVAYNTAGMDSPNSNVVSKTI
jgi:hypothetical protein